MSKDRAISTVSVSTFTTEITEITERKTLLGCWLRVLGVLGG